MSHKRGCFLIDIVENGITDSFNICVTNIDTKENSLCSIMRDENKNKNKNNLGIVIGHFIIGMIKNKRGGR